MVYCCTLQAFQADKEKKLHVTLERKNKGLSIKYQLQSDINQLLIPKNQGSTERKDQLWQHTCFELFLRDNRQPERYWEFNFSPSGEWNAYQFQGYRQKMQTAKGYQHLMIDCQLTPEEFILSTDIPFPIEWLKSDTPLIALNLTAVLEDKQNKISYWALQQATPQADFHAPHCFIALTDLITSTSA